LLENSAAGSAFNARGCKPFPQPHQWSWYALQIQSRLVNISHAMLSGKGYEAYVPSYRGQRTWSDRIKELDLPLFPGYIFCRFDVGNRLPILTTPGVISIVGAGKTPIPVEDEEIESIRTVVHSGLAAEPCPFLGIGSRVQIEDGPLAGIEGIITNGDKVCRLVISVSLLQRSVAVEVDREWARPISNGPHPNTTNLGQRIYG
jgi:transcription antitermination factor NusG